MYYNDYRKLLSLARIFDKIYRKRLVNMLNNPHDVFFKKVFSEREIARDFIENYLPEKVLKIIDTRSIKILKDSFLDNDLKESFSDMVYKVNINNQPGYLYLLFEHKSYPDKMVAFQFLKYLTRLWDLHLKQNTTKKLPVIIPILIYHGKEIYNVNLNFATLLNQQPEVKDYIPDFQYLLYDFSQFSDTEIIGSIKSRLFLQILHNIFKENFEEELGKILLLFRDLENTNTVLEYFEVAMRYIINVREISMSDLHEKVSKTIPERRKYLMTLGDKLREEGRKKGIEEGRKEGIAEGEKRGLQETVSILLTKKLNIKEIPENIQKQIKSGNISTLEKVRDNIFDINSLDDLEKYF